VPLFAPSLSKMEGHVPLILDDDFGASGSKLIALVSSEEKRAQKTVEK